MFNKSYLIIISLSFLAGFATIIGASVSGCCQKSKKLLVGGLSFAAGIMVLISFFELLPSSYKDLGILKTILSFIAGIVALLILNFVLPHSHLIKEKRHEKTLKTAYLTAFGIILHDFPEGFAIASSYIFSTTLGLTVALATLIHNIPEGFAMAVPAIPLKKKGFIIKIAFISGLAGLLGSILGIIFLHFLPGLNAFFLSFTAGAMIFVAIHELLPMARKYKRNLYIFIGVFISIIIYFALFLLFPE